MKTCTSILLFLTLFIGCSQKTEEAPSETITSEVYTVTQSTIYFSMECTGEALETPEESLIEQTITLYSNGKLHMYTGGHCEEASIQSEEVCLSNGECVCDVDYSAQACAQAGCDWRLYEWREERTMRANYTQEGTDIFVTGLGQTDAYDDIRVTLIDNTLTWVVFLGEACIEVVYEKTTL